MDHIPSRHNDVVEQRKSRRSYRNSSVNPRKSFLWLKICKISLPNPFRDCDLDWPRRAKSVFEEGQCSARGQYSDNISDGEQVLLLYHSQEPNTFVILIRVVVQYAHAALSYTFQDSKGYILFAWIDGSITSIHGMEFYGNCIPITMCRIPFLNYISSKNLIAHNSHLR